MKCLTITNVRSQFREERTLNTTETYYPLFGPGRYITRMRREFCRSINRDERLKAVNGSVKQEIW